MTRQPLLLIALLVFITAIAGVAAGRHLFPPRTSAGTDLHAILHQQLELDAQQDRKLHALETSFAVLREALEADMRAENSRLAAAIASEHRIGPRVSAAVDESHRTMGALQKETLAHIFAMRAILRPDQTPTFDAAVTKALTETSQ